MRDADQRLVEQRPEDYQPELLDGFAAMYRFWASNREDILGPTAP
jgi:hypothetical protein